MNRTRPHSSLRRPARFRRTLVMLMAILAVGQAAPSSARGDFGDPGDPGTRKEPNPQPYDIVLANGRVIDPETNLDAEGYHVGIKGDRIAAVSPDELTCVPGGCREIDVKGRVIAPGFIDLHAHGMHVFAMRVQAFDGVTTALELESGLLPIEDFYRVREGGQPINYGAAAAWTFARIAAMNPELGEPKGELEYFANAQDKVEWKRDPAGPEELQRILRYLERGLAQGALGIGMNAGYAPGYGYAEAKAIHRLAARYGVRTFYHLRGTRVEPPNSAMESVEELVDLAAATGSQIHIHHINSSLKRKVAEVGERIKKARRQRLDISTDAYPYGASSTVIGSAAYAEYRLLVSEGYGWENFDYLGGKFNDCDAYIKVRNEQPGAPIVFHFLETERREEECREEGFKKKDCTEKECRKEECWEKDCRVECPPLRSQQDQKKQNKKEQDLEFLFEALSFPDAAIASDGMPWTYVCKSGVKDKLCPEPPEPPQLMTGDDDSTWPFKPTNNRTVFAHPRSAGTYSRILSEYVSWDWKSESRKLTPLEAIRKLTLVPAQILEKSVAQMINKGRLQVGKDADIVVFDPDEVEERATFKAKYGSPWDQQSVGMEYVLVNGVLLIDDGEMQTAVLPGRPIRRAP